MAGTDRRRGGIPPDDFGNESTERDSRLEAAAPLPGLGDSPTCPSPSAQGVARDPQPGEVLGDRYEVLGVVGRGAMSVVLRARDLVADELVAVKLLGLREARDAKAKGVSSDWIARLRRELKAARKVNHAGVVRLHDLMELGDRLALTMELVIGETLQARMAAVGTLTSGELVQLASDLAAALAAAHAAGVIHRDLKPANIMLRASSQRAVITDFGVSRLARPPANRADDGHATTDEQRITAKGTLIGTPLYMAPEQLLGLDDVGPAADVFALGVVLYEAATGRVPHWSDKLVELVRTRVAEATPPLERARPELPPELCRAVDRCLKTSPLDRPADGGQLAQLLQPLNETTRIAAAPRRGRQLAALAVASTLLVAGAGALWLRHLRAPGATGASAAERVAADHHGRRSVAVIGFQNLAARPDSEWLSTALAEMVTTEIAAGEILRTIPGDDVARARAELGLRRSDDLSPDTLASLRRNLGADLVISGSYLVLDGERGAASGLRVDLRLQDGATGELLAAVAESGPAMTLPEIISRAGARLRIRIGVDGVTPADAERVRGTLPASPAAARHYAEGLAFARAGEPLKARTALEAAVTADPQHPLAHAALAATLTELGHDGAARDEAKRALELSSRLAREDALAVEARWLESSYQWAKAADRWRTLAGFFPDRVEYGLGLARAQLAVAPRDALGTVDGLRSMPGMGDDPRVALLEAEVAGKLSDWPRMKAAAIRGATSAKARGARRQLATALLLEGSAQVELGELRAGDATLAEGLSSFSAAGDRGGVGLAHVRRIASLRMLGNHAAARAEGDAALAIFREIGQEQRVGNTLYLMANTWLVQGDVAQASKLNGEALALFRRLGNREGLAGALLNVGNLHFMSHRYPEAQRSYEEALAVFREIGKRAGVAVILQGLAGVHKARADYAAARTAYEEALQALHDVGDKKNEALTMCNLSGMLLEGGQLAEARRLIDRGAALAHEIGDRSNEGYALSLRASLLAVRDELPAALEALQGASALSEEMGEQRDVASLRVMRAGVLADLDRTGEAERAYLEGATAQHRLGDSAEADTLYYLAALQLDDHRLADALGTAARAAALAKAADEPTLLLQRRLINARLDGANGHAERALRSLADEPTRLESSGQIHLALQTRLALGQIELAAKLPGARAHLTALARDANQAGYKAIARHAGAAR